MSINLIRRGGAAVLSIDRPEAKNALSRALVDELDAHLLQILSTPSARVLILHGEGHFAAGADIREMADCSPDEAMDFSFSPVFNRLAALPIPTIAAIEGFALGGGLELALCCDLRIAGRTARMGFPEITLGIMPGAGGTIRAPRLLGAARALELIYTGEVIPADRALALGLVNRVVDEGTALEEALALAERIARFSPVALRTAKQSVLRGLDEPDAEWAVAREAQLWSGLFATSDQREGMAAFLEKRRPVFTGR